MTKPDKQMPDAIYVIPDDECGAGYIGDDWSDPEMADEETKYISETSHLSEIAALEEKHREDKLALLDNVVEIIEYGHSIAERQPHTKWLKAQINQLREQAKKCVK